MTDAVQIALIVGSSAAVPAIIGTIVGALNVAMARRAEERAKRNEQHLEALKHNTDGLKDALVNAAEKESFLRGVMTGGQIAGQPGPQGPAGEPGEQGPRGDRGPTSKPEHIP